MRVRHLAATLVAMSWAMSSQAMPPAPQGWQLQTQGPSQGAQQVYRASGEAYAEVRLFGFTAISQNLRDWFESRTQQSVKDVSIVRAGEIQLAKDLIAYSESLGQDAQGHKLAVIRGACVTPQKQALYGEMLLSTQASYDQNLPKSGLQIIIDACTQAMRSTTQPSPQADAKTKSKNEPEPYAYFKPGAGFKDQQITAIVHAWSNEQAGMTMQVVDYFYVMFNDGSYYEGLPPVAFEDFDAAKSRAEQGRRWGKWRQRHGRFEIAGNASQAAFSDIVNQSTRQPAKRDERLDGVWSQDSAYSTPWSVSRSSRGVRFSSDGRFERSFDSSVVGGAGSEAAGTVVHGATQRHNDCSAGTVGGGNFAGGSSQCRTSTAPDRTGTYRLDGYTLTLRYDSGRIERVPFCARADRKDLWFAGWDMSRQKSK